MPADPHTASGPASPTERPAGPQATGPGDWSHLALTDDTYRVEQRWFRNKYTVYDQQGNEVLRGKQKLFKLKEEFPFEHPDGSPAFTVKAAQVFDFAGDYAILHPTTEQPLLVLTKKFTFFHHAWRIKTPDGTELAHVESSSKVLDVLRGLSSIFALIPYTYHITTPHGQPIGRIHERFSLRDKYDVHIQDPQGIPKPALVTAAIVIDALEGN